MLQKAYEGEKIPQISWYMLHLTLLRYSDPGVMILLKRASPEWKIRDCFGWLLSYDCCWLVTICMTPPLAASRSSGSLDAGSLKALGLSKRARGDTLSFVSQILRSMLWLNNWSRSSVVTGTVWLKDNVARKSILIIIIIMKCLH